ncbi:MTHFR-domain-containing protein [Dacryopinax primogenitus]|uniref:MTHFR-domain-containing protein n=1 Tax=Dacryopinax primogenitus (strain DJM 731) TaxID=1858805 RepID=M5GA04_DACPD|nr:MTHFR-domain-containing protein [Dacryopinax primogenitus]EJU05155.1 MTHFR-domain-containing protein [Dacryopinax primogenitus]
MKLTEAISRDDASTIHPYYTLEFFPPRTDSGFENLLTRLSRLSVLNPIGLTITWGAGGSTKQRSLDLAEAALGENPVTILHLTCTNMERDMLDDTLDNAKARGIQNILALRGDPPRGEEYWIPCDPQFQHASDLVKYIRKRDGDEFCVGVAAYPDGHSLDEDAEIANLKLKVDAGADFIITQLFYDADGFLMWLKKVRESGVEVPVLAGVMPIQSYASFLRMTKLCASRVPPSLIASLEPIRHDDEAVKEFGVEFATDMIRTITSPNHNGPTVQGIHFCTLNLEKSTWRILDNLGWIGTTAHVLDEGKNRLIQPDSNVRPSSASLLITPHDAASAATPKEAEDTGPISHTTTTLPALPANQAVTWDDFPNGRFGSADSAAFGVRDPYKNELGMTAAEVHRLWGQPETIEDLNAMFLKHLRGHSPFSTTPWSPNPIAAETKFILPRLIEFTSKGTWTVASQPAVDCMPSDDEVFGWGPKDGFVFQKAFCEFFCEFVTLERLKHKAAALDTVKFFAANAKGEMMTNMAPGESNAVTWGVFPGKEVMQPTVIERSAFQAWAEEAFGIWSEWALFFPPASTTRQLLERVRDERWLVSVCHHDFKNPNDLWDLLLET